jgi:hypothetical protein
LQQHSTHVGAGGNSARRSRTYNALAAASRCLERGTRLCCPDSKQIRVQASTLTHDAVGLLQVSIDLQQEGYLIIAIAVSE